MRAIVILLVSLLMGCDPMTIRYTKLTCDSGVKTPWVEDFYFQLRGDGYLKYRHGDKWVFDAVKQGDKCVQTFKNAPPGTYDG